MGRFGAIGLGTAVLALAVGVGTMTARGADPGAAGRRAAPGGAFLVDAAGQRVGPVLQTTYTFPPWSGAAAGYAAQVGLRVGDQVLPLWVNRERFLGVEVMPPLPAVWFVVYDGAGCTGNAFLFSAVDQPSYVPRLTPYVAIGAGQALFMGQPPRQAVAALSHWDPLFEICLGGGAVTALPAVEVADLDTLFPPPYRVE